MADTRLKTFSPQTLSIVIAQNSTGITHVVGGFAENSMVTVAREMDAFTPYTGADNTPSRVFNPNSSLSVTITLAQTSNSNAILSQLYANDIALLNDEGLFSITIKDTSGQTVIYAEEAYISKLPDASFTTSIENRDWVITAVRSDYFLGGNSRFSPEDAATLETLGGTIAPEWLPS